MHREAWEAHPEGLGGEGGISLKPCDPFISFRVVVLL